MLTKTQVRTQAANRRRLVYSAFCGAQCVDVYDGRTYLGTCLPTGRGTYVVATWSERQGQWQASSSEGGLAVCHGTGHNLEAAGRALASVGATTFKVRN